MNTENNKFQESLNAFKYNSIIVNRKSYRVNPITTTKIKGKTKNEIKMNKANDLLKYYLSEQESEESYEDNLLKDDSADEIKEEKAVQERFNKEKLEFTYYLSFPIKSQTFLEKFRYFKKTLLSDEVFNISEKLFQKEDKLHITICCLSIDKSQVRKIEELLSEFAKSRSLKDVVLEFSKLDTMHTKSLYRNIYVSPNESDDINGVEKYKDNIDSIISLLIENGLVNEKILSECHVIFNKSTNRWENKIIHCTLLNKKFDEESFFDGSKILKKLRHFSGFGTETFEYIDIIPFGNMKDSIKRIKII